uniref:Uncharacterized protein n=1 Tax=Apteryx owenii TaxID=8824 RepID=A0A8B9PAE0_APTOW
MEWHVSVFTKYVFLYSEKRYNSKLASSHMFSGSMGEVLSSGCTTVIPVGKLSECTEGISKHYGLCGDLPTAGAVSQCSCDTHVLHRGPVPRQIMKAEETAPTVKFLLQLKQYFSKKPNSYFTFSQLFNIIKLV